MLWWEWHLIHIKWGVGMLLHTVKSDHLSQKADTCRQLDVGDSQVSDKLSPSLIPYIDPVMSKCNMIATLTCLEGMRISEFFDALLSEFPIFKVDTSISLDIWTSVSHALGILHHKIHWANSITATIQQHNNSDAVVVQKTRWVQKCHGQGNQLDNVMIQGDWTPRSNCGVRQQGYCPAKWLYAFWFSDRINTGETNATGSGMW